MHPPEFFPKFLIVGFVGTRQMESLEAEALFAAAEPRLRQQLNEIFARLRRENEFGVTLVAVSSLAVNSDTVFAEVAAELDVSHQVYLPHTEDFFFQLSDFGTEAALDRSRGRLAASNVIEVRVASTSSDRRVRFHECGYEIANASDVLIVAYAANATKKPGGTLETLELARAQGKRIFEIVLDGTEGPVETGGKSEGPGAAELPEMNRLFTTRLPGIADTDAYLPAVAALKKHSSAVARRAKYYFQHSAAWVVVTHVAATAIAVWALVYQSSSATIVAVKVILLVAGFGLPIFLHLRKPQREWAMSRIVAELCRSVLSLRGLRGRIDYFRSLRLPELDWFMRSLEIQHLRANAATPTDLKAFAEFYERHRVDTQLHFYRSQCDSAEKSRRGLEGAIYALSAAALLAAAIYFAMQRGWIPQALGMEHLVQIVPIAFPVIAVACGSLISTFDLDRRIERFRDMGRFLHEQRKCLRVATSETMLVRIVNRTEHALLEETAVWYGKHAYVRGD